MNLMAPLNSAWALVPIFFFIGSVVVAILLVMLICWILYTVVWMGVRRGLREYYGPGPYRGFSEPEQQNRAKPPLPVEERRHRSGRLTR